MEFLVAGFMIISITILNLVQMKRRLAKIEAKVHKLHGELKRIEPHKFLRNQSIECLHFIGRSRYRYRVIYTVAGVEKTALVRYDKEGGLDWRME